MVIAYIDTNIYRYDINKYTDTKIKFRPYNDTNTGT